MSRSGGGAHAELTNCEPLVDNLSEADLKNPAGLPSCFYDRSREVEHHGKRDEASALECSPARRILQDLGGEGGSAPTGAKW